MKRWGLQFFLNFFKSLLNNILINIIIICKISNITKLFLNILFWFMTNYFTVFNEFIKIKIIIFCLNKRIRLIERHLMEQHRFITSVRLMTHIYSLIHDGICICNNVTFRPCFMWGQFLLRPSRLKSHDKNRDESWYWLLPYLPSILLPPRRCHWFK